MEDLNRPKADALFVEAQKLFTEENYLTAKTKIAEAIKMYPQEQKYAHLGGTIDRFLEIQQENERLAREKAEAEKEVKRLEDFHRPTVPLVEERKAGDRLVKTIKGVEYAWRWCPAGSFMMGKGTIKKSDFNRQDEDIKCLGQQVEISHGFWMLETEVTQEMWESVMENCPSWFSGKGLPVERVTWDDCVTFCQKLSLLAEMDIRLPTEAQWEYACRAGTETNYNFGDSCNEQNANYAKFEKELKKTTVACKSYPPNSWGLYDMHGNVMEWCSDRYELPKEMSTPVKDPTVEPEEDERICRGGSWFNYEENCTSKSRWKRDRTIISSTVGLRPVLFEKQD